MAITPEEGLSKETIYEGRIFKVIKEQVRIHNGKVRTRDIVVHPGAVALVVVDNDGKLILIHQYRRAAGQVLLEIPAGTRELNEDPEACAVRETQEETGYRPRKVERLGGFFSAPGFCTEFLHCYLLTDLEDSRIPGDEDENIEIERFTLDEAIAAIQSGKICDAKTIAGILMYAHRSQ
jgi:ADP-ribose pyrophosphatase